MRLVLTVLLLCVAVASYALDIDSIAYKLNKQYSIPIDYTRGILSRARVVEDVRSFIYRVENSPEKTYPFGEFVKLFVNKRRIEDGVDYYLKHRELLERIYKRFGVNPCIVVAILSIETDLGRIKPKTNALNALYTLSIYSRRRSYFLSELESFIVYTYRHKLNPFTIKGSLTAAMGMPQFMPSNIDRYGVDFNGNGLNLDEEPDAFASIANYLIKHGWKRSERVVEYLSSDKGYCLKMKGKRLKGGRVVVFSYKQGVKCFLAFKNFWALKRYNGTKNYAMAAYRLSEEICKRIR